ncbi:MAG: nucleotide pyrophosphohydrolase [Desulfobacterales bacterium SG8_35_2]|nr:MAG: nucleotide pyrophosphohydrolase [Desulfobacterales bacterium SG8_35_2]
MRFMNIVNQLRSEKGCPWDRKQSPLSLKRYILEETHELLAAIDADDHQHVKEELGDLLYLIILLAQIHSEKQFFNMSEVIEAISDKMVRRHPHVFQDEQFDSEAQLREKWLAIKAREKSDRAKAKKN